MVDEIRKFVEDIYFDIPPKVQAEIIERASDFYRADMKVYGKANTSVCVVRALKFIDIYKN